MSTRHIPAPFLSVLAVAVVLGAAGAASAQPTMPSGGATNTLSLEGTVSSTSVDGGTLVVTAVDGSTRLFKLAGKMFVHGASPSDGALSDLRRGMPVVIHYRADGQTLTAEEVDRLDTEGLKTTEGRVIGIDRGRGEIKVLLPDDKTETLKLTDRAAQSVGQDLDNAKDATIVVYYKDDVGQKVVHYFKKK